MLEYYRQRATAGLILSEAISPSPNALGYSSIPSLCTPEQLASWQPITKAVHDEGGHIFAQLMHVGRIFHPLNLPEGAEGLAPSAIAAKGQMWTDQQGLQDYPTPRAMTTAEVREARDEFAHSARLAIEAGFDGVEILGATGFLLDQFLNPDTNQRTDEYGGSVQNRAHLLLEVTHAVAEAIGPERTGIRLSPWATINDMTLYPEMDETYIYLTEELEKIGIEYLHLIDHEYIGAPPVPAHVVPLVRERFTRTLILSGGYTTLARIEAALAGPADLVAIGRPFISNPDLVARLKAGIPLSESDRATYYAPGPEGHIDYPTATAQPASAQALGT
jgi:N-ethylmaleimide reductase